MPLVPRRAQFETKLGILITATQDQWLDRPGTGYTSDATSEHSVSQASAEFPAKTSSLS